MLLFNIDKSGINCVLGGNAGALLLLLVLLKKGAVTYFSNVDFELQIDWSEEELVKLNGESVFKLELFPSKNNENILIKGKFTTLK